MLKGETLWPGVSQAVVVSQRVAGDGAGDRTPGGADIAGSPGLCWTNEAIEFDFSNRC